MGRIQEPLYSKFELQIKFSLFQFKLSEDRYLDPSILIPRSSINTVKSFFSFQKCFASACYFPLALEQYFKSFARTDLLCSIIKIQSLLAVELGISRKLKRR